MKLVLDCFEINVAEVLLYVKLLDRIGKLQEASVSSTMCKSSSILTLVSVFSTAIQHEINILGGLLSESAQVYLPCYICTW